MPKPPPQIARVTEDDPLPQGLGKPPAPHNHKQLFIISTEAWRSLDNDEVEATVKDMEELGIYKLPYPSVNIRAPFDVVTAWEPEGAVGPPDVMREMIRAGKVVWNERKQAYDSNLGPGAWIDIENIQLDHLELAREYVTVDATSADFRPFRHAMWPSKEGLVHIDRNGLVKGTPLTEVEQQINIARSAMQFAKALIVLLATRNAVKNTKHNPLARHGFGVKKDSSKRYDYVTTITTPILMDPDSDRPPSGREVCAHLRRGHARRQHFGPNNSYLKKIWIEPVFVNADKEWIKTRKAYNLGVAIND